MTRSAFVERTPGVRLAVLEDGPHAGPERTGFFWLGGFGSDMAGSKAEMIASLGEAENRPVTRFDYAGHGISDGVFEQGSIGDWFADALAVFRSLAQGPRILAGSSMGAWIACLLYRALNVQERAQVKGLILLAPAHDFTQTLLWDRMDAGMRARLEADGSLLMPTPHGEPFRLTRKLIEDGRTQCLLGAPFPVDCPCVILQGTDDTDVPPDHAMQVFRAISGPDVRFVLIKNGDHRLSRPQDLDLLAETARSMAGAKFQAGP